MLGPQQHVVRLMKALPHPDVATVIGRVWSSDAQPLAKLAFEFLVLTAASRSDVRWDGWEELDAAKVVWIVPETRMKVKGEYRLPLDRRALRFPTKCGHSSMVLPG